MHIDTQESLHAQHEKWDKWDNDLLVSTILEMMGGPFKGTSYLTLPLVDAIDEVHTYLGVLQETKYKKHVNRILRKVDKLESTRDIVLYLGDVLLSDQ